MRRRAGRDHRVGNFSYMNTPARIPGLSGTKHFRLRMACKVANKLERGSTGILEAFWTFFISVTGIKFPIYMNRRQNSSCLPGQHGYRTHMKRPLEATKFRRYLRGVVYYRNFTVLTPVVVKTRARVQLL